MAELAEGARLLSECGGKLPPRVRIPLSPPHAIMPGNLSRAFFCLNLAYESPRPAQDSGLIHQKIDFVKIQAPDGVCDDQRKYRHTTEERISIPGSIKWGAARMAKIKMNGKAFA